MKNINIVLNKSFKYGKFIKPATVLMAKKYPHISDGIRDKAILELAQDLWIGSQLTKGKYIASGVIIGAAVTYFYLKNTEKKSEEVSE